MQLYKFPFVGIFGGLFVLGFDLALLCFFLFQRIGITVTVRHPPRGQTEQVSPQESTLVPLISRLRLEGGKSLKS